MHTTIDSAGRLVVPKTLRDHIGLVAGQVDITVDGARLLITPIASDDLVEENGRLVIPATGSVLNDEMVRNLRDADQR